MEQQSEAYPQRWTPEPWMSLHPSVTPEQWHDYRIHMSPQDWESYCAAWRTYYQSLQRPVPLPYAQAYGYAVPYGYMSYPPPVKKPSAVRKLFGAIWPFWTYLGIQLLLGVALAVVMIGILFATGASDIDAVVDEMLSYAMYLTVLSQLIMFPLCMVYFRKNEKREREANVERKNANRAVPLAILGMAASAGIFMVVSGALSALMPLLPSFITESYEQAIGQMDLGPEWLIILSTVLFAPVVEELALRGLVQKQLSTFLPSGAALLLASALFGILHLNPLQGLYAFLLGLYLGWIYQRCDNLLIPILGHLAFNGMNYVPIPGLADVLTRPALAALIGAAVASAGVLAYHFVSRDKRQNVRQTMVPEAMGENRQ